MPHLYELLKQKVSAWRQAGYPSDRYPAIAEILEYAPLPESEALRFLRAAQLRALETYWYLRLVEGTPQHIRLVKGTAEKNDLKLGRRMGVLGSPNFAVAKCSHIASTGISHPVRGIRL